ncbi:uncharacterized protein C8orf76 homolog isoform X2 [Trichosurus vulpecula]|uniref:uncharacterized protein C8orf76 homolog isoform X2 n=1 Tax=Trichosurus vulpecula TaxID=9337 RepID=UPI00186AE733|nr:uncharacterized protein C8orf76 homolog isoform X2 [Trichosurus vulpecula]
MEPHSFFPVLGGEFEDSIFEEWPRSRELEPLPAYSAKRCEPQWFYEETENKDEVEMLTIKKFRGDSAYRRQEFQKALQEYSSCFELLPSTNFAMRRDVQEGQARCLTHLGRHMEALEIAEKLGNGATNSDHLTAVLYLQLTIYSSLKNIEKTILCLQKLISLHHFNPWNWAKLAEAYLSLGLALSTSFTSSQKENSFMSSDQEFKSPFLLSKKDPSLHFSKTLNGDSGFSMETSGSLIQKSENSVSDVRPVAPETPFCLAFQSFAPAVWAETQVKACASFVRARLLLQLTQSQQTSFALEKNFRAQEEIEDRLKGFGFEEETLLLISEVMREDLIPEKIKDEVHTEVKCVGSEALTALVIASSKEFEDKWFRKIKDHLCPFENLFHTEICISP